MHAEKYQTKAGAEQFRPVLTEAEYRRSQWNGDNAGFCLACGADADGCEPDAPLPRLPESTEARTFAEIGADRLELQAKLSAARLRILADECGQPAVAYLLRFEAVRLDRARGVRL